MQNKSKQLEIHFKCTKNKNGGPTEKIIHIYTTHTHV